MEQSVQELCWLIQEALFEKRHDFNITDSGRLYHIAKENGLSGTVFEVVKNHGISDEMYVKFQKDFYKYVAQDEEQLRCIGLITGLLKANNIKHVFLKGSILKNIYPQTYMRSMGDIDLLVKDSDKKLTHELFVRLDMKLKSKNYVHDVYETSSGLSIEVHSRLKKEKESFPSLDNIDEIVKEYTFNHELEVVYLLYHLRKHLLTSGIGLRSVVDLGVYLLHYEDEIDFIRLDNLLVQSSLSKLFMNIMEFNEIYLDMLFNHFEKNREDINHELLEAFTEYIVLSGIHGIGVSFNRFTGIVSSPETKHFRRLSFLFKIVFMPYRDVKYIYPRLLKCRLFLPIAWMLRAFDLIFLNRKRRMYRLKELQKSKIKIKAAKDMFHKLGI